MEIKLPEFTLVALIGPSGAGKSYFAAQYFKASEVISQAQFAAITGDDGSHDKLHAETMALMYRAIEIRLQYRKSCIVDAELLTPIDRAELRRLARKYHVRLAAIVLDTPAETCIARNLARIGSPDRAIIRRQISTMEQTINFLKEEGLKTIYRIGLEETDISLRRLKAHSDMREIGPPFDIIGDVHGCLDELMQLVAKLGYVVTPATAEQSRIRVQHPLGRKLIFVGDLGDRGPNSPGVFRLVMDTVAMGDAYCVPGNHDDKLMRHLSGNKVQLKHGLEKTVAQLEGYPAAFHAEVKEFIESLSTHIELDGGKLVVAHAGLKAGMHGRSSGEIHSFCLYGETTGETDEFGLPVRQNWATDYDGTALVVYGHTPIPEPSWENNTVNIDTGCVFGGELTALRYPERSTLAVPAMAIHCQPSRPMHWIGQPRSTTVVDHSISMEWTSPQVLVSTTDGYNLNLDETAFQSLGCHLIARGVHSRWLIYAPATISPPTVSTLPGLLEHPAQAIDYYRKKGVVLLTARPQYHGTAVTIVLCRNAAVAERRFALTGQGLGSVYTRSGRPYFDDADAEQAFLISMSQALEREDTWSQLKSDWICMEAVAAPITAKAPCYVSRMHDGVAHTALHSLAVAQRQLEAARKRGLPVENLLKRMLEEQKAVETYQQAAAKQQKGSADKPIWYIHQLLAVEGQVLLGQSQLLQQALIEQIVVALGASFQASVCMQADLDSENSLRALTAWWEELNVQGSPGIVIGPQEMRMEKSAELMQPWIKVRCKEHLRLLFGPNYDAPAMLLVLQQRNLRLKRETAVREYSLAKEALKRFVAGQPFDAVYQCVYTLLGLELRLIDPRL